MSERAPMLFRPDDVSAFFAEISLAVTTATDPVSAFEEQLPIVAETAKQSGLGRANVVDRLQNVAKAAGICRKQGEDWVTERIATVAAALTPPQKTNGHRREQNAGAPLAERLRDVEPTGYGAPIAAEPSAKFVLIGIDDVRPDAGPAWLIDRVLPAQGLAFVVGPPKSRKSFFTTDMLFSVARGVPYAGREVLAGPVVYLTGEGVSGFKRRLVAMRRHYAVEGQAVPFFMVENVPDLGSESTDLETLLRDLDAFLGLALLEAPRAIVLDTLARCMGDGDESTARDMGRFLARCSTIERYFGCLVVVVHHMGKNPAAGGRGSNAQNGAADVTLTVEKADDYSTVRIDEMKDGDEGQEWRFRLLSVDLSEANETPSEAGTEATTCVVELLSEPSEAKHSEAKSRKPVRGVNGDLLKVIRRAIDEAGERNVADNLVPRTVSAIDRATLRRFCKSMAWQDQDAEPDSFRNVLNRSLKALRAVDAIGFTQDWIWTT